MAIAFFYKKAIGMSSDIKQILYPEALSNLRENVPPVQCFIWKGRGGDDEYDMIELEVYPFDTIEDIKRNISLASLKSFVSMGLVNNNEEFKKASEYRDSMNIKAPSVLSITGQLSGGNQQKVVLSKWINVNPDVLILDEPTRGIDVGAKYEIYLIIQRLAAEGKGIIVISSELPELLGICDRIYAIAEGRITGEVERKDATPELLMKYMTTEKGRS
jgi:putative multiple sugar transport system ATP-binding protein